MIRVAILQIIFEYFIILQKCQDLQMLAVLTNTYKKVEWIKQDGSISYLCKVETEVLELWLAFFQAVVMDTETLYLVALPSSMWLSRFQSLSSSSWGRTARAGGVWRGSLYEPGLEGHTSPPAISCWWELGHIVIVTAKCKGCQGM